MSDQQPQEDDTPEQQIRQRITDRVEQALQEEMSVVGIPITDFTPYLLVKIVEQLEYIERRLESLDSSVMDFWNTRYNHD